MTRVEPEDFARAANLDEIYVLLERLGIENGWAKKSPSLWPQPRRTFKPAHWSYRRAVPAACHRTTGARRAVRPRQRR